MRVIAGSARRIPLKTPDGNDTRPTQDRIKETLFNIIQNDVPGAVFVDFFCGSGGIGIEALSRGAKKAYFIEIADKPVKYLYENLEKTRLADRAVVMKSDVFSALHRISEDEADIIYLDPPYMGELYERTLRLLAGARYVTDNTLIIAESHLDTSFEFAEEFGLVIMREKCYKNNKHVFLKKAGS